MGPKEIVNEMLLKDSFSNWAKMKVVSIAPGECDLELIVVEEMLNGFNRLHGGIAFSLADSALAFAANAKGRKAFTINSSCSFISSIQKNEVLVAQARELKSGQNIGFYLVNVFSKEKMVFTSTFTVFFTAEKWGS